MRALRGSLLMVVMVVASLRGDHPQQTPLPEQTAYNEANRITDPVKKLDAYRAIVAAYPTSDFLRQVNGSILNTLLDLPDRANELGPAFDVVAAAASKAADAETRLSIITAPVMRMLDKGIVLDQAEPAIAQALAAMNFDAYATVQRAQKARAKQPEPTRATLDAMFGAARGNGLEVLARWHRAKGDIDRAVDEFKQALTLNRALSVAPIALAEIEVARGHESLALDYYLTAASGGKLKGADEKTFIALYKKIRGKDANPESEIDATFRRIYPNPVHPEKWTPASPSERVVLVELFTGSGCLPCVAADYAFEAILERYPASVLAPLVYHVHIPQPDPMTTPGSTARKAYYSVTGVPTVNVDGTLSKLGGGARELSDEAYTTYTQSIEHALTVVPGATLDVRATRENGRLRVTTTISRVASGTKGLRLNLVVAEPELRFSGENGMRFHPMVVRSVAGAPLPDRAVTIDASGKATTEYAYGLPVALDAAGRATVDYTFDLSLSGPEITRSLDDEIAKRRKAEAAGTTPREFKAEGRALAAISPTMLYVVAFVQDDAKHVLQAARVSVTPTGVKTP